MKKIQSQVNLISKINLGLFLLIYNIHFSQDIEPRRWTTMPLGSNIVGVGYVHTFGDIIFDPLLNVDNATVLVNSIALSYVRPFKIGNRLARVDVLIPYSFAKWEGNLNDVPTTVTRNGFSDPRLRVSYNFIGPKAMTVKEFQEFLKDTPTYTTVGASLAISFPLGQYYNDKLLNLGYNCFVFRPQVGMVHNWGNWSYELTGSVFFYTNNNDFFNNQTKKQEPLFAMQTHLVRKFKHRIWSTLSFGYGQGGNSIVNKQTNNDERGNFIGGISAGMPIFKTQSIKLAYATTLTLKDVGANTNGLLFGWSTIF